MSVHLENVSNYRITLSDKTILLPGPGRCDDGCNDNLVSPKLAEAAVLTGVERITAITFMNIKVSFAANISA